MKMFVIDGQSLSVFPKLSPYEQATSYESAPWLS